MGVTETHNWDGRCNHCGEPLLEGEGLGMNPTFHTECFTRLVVNSVGHQLGLCSCYGGNQGDPPNLTIRQAAVAAVKIHRKLVDLKSYLIGYGYNLRPPAPPFSVFTSTIDHLFGPWKGPGADDEGLSITCPKCGRTSRNPNDVQNRYCGACHEYHDDMDLLSGSTHRNGHSDAT